MSKKKKKENRNNGGTIFFAYQSKERSGNCDNVDAIQSLASSLGPKAIIWEKMKVNGKLINKQILLEIDKAEIFACDLTYLNSNVFFELGFAIGKRKHLFVMLNSKIKDAVRNYENIDILKGIGYSDFSNSDDLKKKIENDVDKNGILLDQLRNIQGDKLDSIDVFYIKSSSNSQAELDTIAFIKNSNYTQICDDSSEIAYQPLEWYIEALYSSRNVIVHLSSTNKTDADLDNAKNSLYAGLAYAIGKKVLLVATKPYNAPIDYNDILLEYSSAKECVENISQWLPRKKKTHKAILNESEKELNLLKLGIGYSVAEDEKEDLLSYFIETQAYRSALTSRSSIFYGRKGTGKTALYIKLFNDFTTLENTYVIGLKPESIELVENIKTVVLYQDVASKKSLFHSIWKYVIYSKMIIDIHLDIIRYKKEYSNEEQNIIDFRKEKNDLLQMNFIETLKAISDKCSKEKMPVDQVIDEYNRNFLFRMQEMIKSYFRQKKYYKVTILADNLDKAWDADSDLSLQAEMILSLLEVSGKLQQELVDKKDVKVDTAVVLFLRSDIYKYVIGKSREPDKLTVISHEVEWESYRDLLKKLVEKRMRFVLGLDETDDISAIWKGYFDLEKDDPYEIVQSACLPRPRDLLFFIGKMFESACNHSHSKVERTDYEYALGNYTNFLYQNLVAEMSAEYPYIRQMIGELHLKFSKEIEIGRFRELVKKYEQDDKKAKQLITELFQNEYLIAIDSQHNERFIKYEDALLAEDKIKSKWKMFSRNNIYIIQHPRYAKIKI